MILKKYFFLLLVIILMVSFIFSYDTDVSETSDDIGLQQLLEQDIDDLNLAAPELIQNFYQLNNYQFAWQQQAKITTLLQAIEQSSQQGLNPQDYYLTSITEQRANRSKLSKAQFDLILTDALIRLSYHQIFGKLSPQDLDANWNMNREFLTNDPVAKLSSILQSTSNLKQFIAENTQSGPFYQSLIVALEKYKKIAKAGGWQHIPDGQTIKPRMQDNRIPAIKAYLQINGDLPTAKIDLTNFDYDKETEAGIKQFQLRHQIEPDGVLGKDSLAQMNVPIDHRIAQIKANLERLRWVKRNVEDEFVLVNIAGYMVYYIKNNDIIWQSKAQVGKNYRKTPVFKDDIKYVTFNPTWTVPPTILRKDVLPKIKQDRNYLTQKDFNVVDHKGKVIDPATIDWPSVTARNFPYMIRQEPGPKNALGQIKIMFPNTHLVYLHDTPSKRLFDRAERAFSSGCIRVEKPFELVELLLNDKTKWNQQQFDQILQSGKLQNVRLPQTVPVLLLYFTVKPDSNGQVIFYKDIYNRDLPIIDGLKQAVSRLKPIN
jgi:L,D-transpeptidase YcbB